jgi:hypothetical protein
VRRGADNAVVGVFEIYADVTPCWNRSKASSEQLSRLVAANQGKIEQTAKRDIAIVAENSEDLLRVVGGLLILLFATLLYIVRRGQLIIDRQSAARRTALPRSTSGTAKKWRRMAALAANVSHETGNALTVIAAPRTATRGSARRRRRRCRCCRQHSTAKPSHLQHDPPDLGLRHGQRPPRIHQRQSGDRGCLLFLQL